MKKSFFIVSIVALLVSVTYLSFAADSKAPAAAAAAKTYSGTIYVAGMGGHFAKADVTIDPSNADEPVK